MIFLCVYTHTNIYIFCIFVCVCTYLIQDGGWLSPRPVRCAVVPEEVPELLSKMFLQ